MAHSHRGHHHHHHHDNSAGNLRAAFFLNFGFTLIEIVGGLLTNSVAVLSDAVHDAGDSLSLGIAWYLQRVSGRAATPSFTYGYRRFSTLGAFITSLVLLIGIVVILFQAVPRLLNPEPVEAGGMIALAFLGIAVNGAAALKTRGGTSLNERVVSLHLFEDVLGWVAVLLGALVIQVWNVPIIDPLLSIGIALYIGWGVMKSLVQVGRVFLQSAPEGFDVSDFESRALALPGVLNSHHTHSWTTDGQHHVLTTHLVMQPGTSREEMVQTKLRVRDLLQEHEFSHLTIEIELEGEACSDGEC